MNEQERQEEVLDIETPIEEETQEKNLDETSEVQEETRMSRRKKKEDKEKVELKNANLELKEKVLRITAEMQNMRRRYELDLSNACKYDGIDLIEKILPIIDNFERAMNVKLEGSEKFIDGFKMIHNNLLEILKTKGVTEIEALDKEFDPNYMNAVLTECDNEKDNNIVLEVLQKGYMYNDRIIRPAMVKVNNKESE